MTPWIRAMGGACTTPQEVEYEVVLHTYNACTGPAQAFLGLLGGGGAYVSGIEVGGAEYSSMTGDAIRRSPASLRRARRVGEGATGPRHGDDDAGAAEKDHSQRAARVQAGAGATDAVPYTYDLVSHNGNHFSTALALALGVDPPPPSLNALANTANMAANLLGSLAGQFGGAMGQGDALCHRRTVPMHAPVPVAQGVSS